VLQDSFVPSKKFGKLGEAKYAARLLFTGLFPKIRPFSSRLLDGSYSRLKAGIPAALKM
jgi:hypothetical protein